LNLLELSRSLVHSCCPIRIGVDNSEGGNRIGGTPPSGVKPAVVKPWTRYFLTLALEDEREELSIFLAAQNPSEILTNRFRLMKQDSQFLQLVFHPPACRANQAEFASDLSAHHLVIESEIPDLISEPGAVDHKIGGLPYYHHDYVGQLGDDTNHALSSGYHHFLQFSFPGSEDGAMEGNWPFGEYVFHLFAKWQSTNWDFLYGWA